MRLFHLFRNARTPVRRPSARPAVEALESREVRTVGFSVSGSALTITGDGRDNTIHLVNDGNGLITATGIPNYPTAGFSGITSITVNTGDGADRVFYDQGTFPSAAFDLRRNLTLNVDLGDNLPFTNDIFAATVNGNIGFFDGSRLHARDLFFNINGGNGADGLTNVRKNHGGKGAPGAPGGKGGKGSPCR